ncbi:MAG: DMT family transporter [Alphaproteobacteria bacterium]|nr:DMT family transporter [Alphaproteobacteria bacterium]
MAPPPSPVARRPPSVLRGILLMVLATAAFMAMQGAIRFLTFELPPFVIAFYRNFGSLLILAPWTLRMGLHSWRAARPGVHLLRGGINVVSMLCQFTALSMTPLAEVTALSFTAPLFATLGATLFLGEKMRLRRWTALAVGFVGALVILRPGFAEVGAGPLLAVFASALWATALLIIKLQARTDSSLTITLYMALVMTPLSLLAALPWWVWPDPRQLAWLAAVAALGTLGQMALAQSFREADATAVMPFDFLKLLWAAAIGFVAFGEMPDAWTWTGGAVIFSSTLYIAWREAKTKRDGGVRRG